MTGGRPLALAAACDRAPPARCAVLRQRAQAVGVYCAFHRYDVEPERVPWMKRCLEQAGLAGGACNSRPPASTPARRALYRACKAVYRAVGVQERPWAAQQAQFDGLRLARRRAGGRP